MPKNLRTTSVLERHVEKLANESEYVLNVLIRFFFKGADYLVILKERVEGYRRQVGQRVIKPLKPLFIYFYFFKIFNIDWLVQTAIFYSVQCALQCPQPGTVSTGPAAG